jgi:hypothetical protein
MADSKNASYLGSGFHSRGVLPHLKREGGVYFVTFRQAGSLPREVLLGFKQEREMILRHALAAKRPLTWHEQEDLRRCINYTRMNPVHAGLCAEPHLWPWSSAHAAQPSPAAGSSTVPGLEPRTGGETPPKPAGADACATTLGEPPCHAV